MKEQQAKLFDLIQRFYPVVHESLTILHIMLFKYFFNVPVHHITLQYNLKAL